MESMLASASRRKVSRMLLINLIFPQLSFTLVRSTGIRCCLSSLRSNVTHVDIHHFSCVFCLSVVKNYGAAVVKLILDRAEYIAECSKISRKDTNLT